MRLFKLLIIGIIVTVAYLYTQQHSTDTPQWETIAVGPDISIQFPQQPVSKSFHREIPGLGNIKLTTFQSAKDTHIFVLLWAQSLKKDIRGRSLISLLSSVHAINDTTGLKISNEKEFMFRNHRGIEYEATNRNGASIWCRTIKKDNQLISIIYGSNSQDIDKQIRDNFLNSLQL
ncbi:MAG: hypothetical protein PVG20_06370 [Thioalkalispiraceae bacterium]|jgi:hypothetical protein